MDTTTTSTSLLDKPKPTLQPKLSFSSQERLSVPSQDITSDHEHDYDPCQNAKICSPFYMYNHDSPRPSADGRQPSKQSIHVSVRDLELGTITPSITQEKINAQQAATGKGAKFRLWATRQKRCLIKPKQRKWLHTLPKKQRTLVKLAIALLIVGVMIGVAVGIAAGLHSGVYGSDKIVGEPHS